MNRPSPPPEAAKLFEAALDVFVYAPIGFLLDAREVVPKLAERGRSQVTLAKFFGRYALQLGQAEAERVLSRQRAADAARSTDDATDAETTPAAGDAAASAAKTAADAAEAAATMANAATIANAATTASDAAAATPVDAAESTVVPEADELPIPGYDALSASQVVPRLDALLPHELEAVRAYESAHRGRRTILNRIAQRLA